MKPETRAKNITEKEQKIRVLEYVVDVLKSNGYQYSRTGQAAEQEIAQLKRSIVASKRELAKAISGTK